MSYDLKMVTCGTHESIENTELCSPIPNTILFDPNKIKKFINNYSTSVFFIILFLDLFNQNIDSILTELNNRDNIIAILICGNSIYNSAINQSNIFRISRHLITYKTTSYAIRSYESASRKLYALGNKGYGYVLEQKANDLKRWLITSDKLKSCHVLIIPLNTTDANLFDFQQSLIELCNDLCGDNEPTVCTIYDYIASDESDSNMLSDSRFFIHNQNGTICHFIERLAPIRIYLVGNERYITNPWSRLLIARELDNNHESTFKYIDRCTFMEHDPVKDEIKRDLATFLGCKWQVTKTMPIGLDDIRNDIYFPFALERVYASLEERERATNIALHQRSIEYLENSSEYSSEFQMTGQAQHGPMEEDDGVTGQIDNIIHCNYMQSFPN